MIVSHRVPNPVPRAYLPEGAGSPQRPNRCLVNTRYDAEGNLVKQVRRSDGYTRTFQYDNANEETAVTDATADGTVQQQLTFKYDVFGNRLEKDVWTIQSG